MPVILLNCLSFLKGNFTKVIIGILIIIIGIYYIRFNNLSSEHAKLQSEMVIKNAQVMLLLSNNAQSEVAKRDVEERYKQMEERISEYNNSIDNKTLNDEESNQWIESIPPPGIKSKVK